MVKNDTVNKWDKRENDVFSHITQTIAETPAFYNPEFGKDFLLYTFDFDTSLVVVLT